MNLIWQQTKLKTGIVAEYAGKRLTIIRRRPKEFHAYVGERRLADSQTRREALDRIFDAIDLQGKLFPENE